MAARDLFTFALLVLLSSAPAQPGKVRFPANTLQTALVLHDDGSLTCMTGCWRPEWALRPSNLGSVSSICLGDEFGCAVARGRLRCWGDDYRDLTILPSALLNSASVSAVSCGYNHACAVNEGQLYCWGDSSSGQTTLPPAVQNSRNVSAVSSSEDSTCAVTEDQLYCWGDSSAGFPSRVSFVSNVWCGFQSVCAVVGGHLRCWGGGDVPQAVTQSSSIGSFCAGMGFACAVIQGKPHCWGRGYSGLSQLPTTLESSTSVSAIGCSNSVCAAWDTDKYDCWGDYWDGRYRTISGTARLWLLILGGAVGLAYACGSGAWWRWSRRREARAKEEAAAQLLALQELNMAQADRPEYWAVTIMQIGELWGEIKDNLLSYSKDHMHDSQWRHVCLNANCTHDHLAAHYIRVSSLGSEEPKPLEPDMHLVVRRYIKPQTRPYGCSYARMKNPSGLKADLFVSHCWGQHFRNFVAIVQDMLPEDTTVWMSSLSLNQNSDLKAKLKSDVWKHPFARAISASSQVILVWDEVADPFARSWCVYEMYLTRMAMADAGHAGKRFDLIMEDYAKFPEMIQSLKDLNVRTCSASSEEDQCAIIEAIGGKEDEVKHKVNELVEEVVRKVQKIEKADRQSWTQGP